MREFCNGTGVTIVDFGMSLNVNKAVATVHYDGAQADYFDAVNTGKVFSGVEAVLLDRDQRNWLERQREWVERRVAGATKP